MSIDADSNQTPSPLQRMSSLTGAEKEEDRNAGLLLDSSQVGKGGHSIDQVLQIFKTLPTYAVAVAKMHADRSSDWNRRPLHPRLTWRRSSREFSTGARKATNALVNWLAYSCSRNIRAKQIAAVTLQ